MESQERRPVSFPPFALARWMRFEGGAGRTLPAKTSKKILIRRQLIAEEGAGEQVGSGWLGVSRFIGKPHQRDWLRVVGRSLKDHPAATLVQSRRAGSPKINRAEPPRRRELLGMTHESATDSCAAGSGHHVERCDPRRKVIKGRQI